MIEQLSHQVARAKQPRAHARFGNAQHRGNLHARQLLERRKHQHLALLCRQLLHAGQHVRMMLRRGRRSVRRESPSAGSTRASSATSSVSGRVFARRLRSSTMFHTMRISQTRWSRTSPRCRDGAARAETPPARHLRHRRHCAEPRRLRGRASPAYWSTSAASACLFRVPASLVVHSACLRISIQPANTAWLALIHHQTQARAKCSKRCRHSRVQSKDSRSLGPLSPTLLRAAYCLPASFCAAIEPAAPSLSASLTLAHSARAWSCLPVRDIQIGQVKLRHCRRNRHRRLGNRARCRDRSPARRDPSGGKVPPAPAWPGSTSCDPTIRPRSSARSRPQPFWPSSS